MSDNNTNTNEESKSFEEEMKERRERRKKKEKKHSILANYYNLQKKLPEKKSAPGDIDGNNFDTKVYFDKVLSKKTMPELIQYDLKLKGAIQKLDNNMKTLVYDNYNKFISATQTIKDMKENVKSMDEKMNMLKKNMEKITNISGGINNTLEKRRGTIQELGEVYRLLKGRQFLFDLPSRLKKDIEFEAYDDAVKYFNLTHHVFETYKHLPSFSSIYEECEQTMAIVRKKLYEQIEDTKAPLSKTKDAIDLLLQLGEKPLPLREIYLERSKKSIDEVIKSSGEILEQDEKKKEPPKTREKEEENKEGEEKKKEEEQLKEEDDDNAPVIVAKLSSHILPVCLKQFRSYEELFITTTVSFKPEEKQHSEAQFKIYAKEVINKFYDLLSPHFANCDDANEFVSALEVMEKYLFDLDSQIDMPISEIIDGLVIDAVISYTEKDYKQLFSLVKDTIDNLEIDLQKKLEESRKEEPKKENNPENKETIDFINPPKSPKRLENFNLRDFCKSINDNITVNIKKFLENLKPFVAKKGNFLAKHAQILLGNISEKLRKLLISIQNQSTLNYRKDPTKELVNTRYRYQLLLSNILKDFGLKGSKEVTKTISILHSLANVKLEVKFDRFSDKFIQLSHDILKNYVLSNGRNISKMIRGSIEVFDWMNPKLGVPRDVRNAVCVVVNNIQMLHEEVSSSIGIEKSQNKNNSVSNYKQNNIELEIESPTGNRVESRIEDQLTRMFKEKIMIFDKFVDFKTDDIMISILKIFLKSFYETIRLRTFNQNAFHQLQVDIHYIKTILSEIVSPQRFEIIDSLLSEAYSSAVDRCVEPSNLAKTILINICESKLHKQSPNTNNTNNSNNNENNN